MKFSSLALDPSLIKGVDNLGFKDCTLVQEKVLPISLCGKDTMVQSKTGSGKTAIFLLTIFQKYLENRDTVALIVAPTRELAVQIEEDAKALSREIKGYKIGCFYGGVGYEKQEKEISSNLNLYVGTPGRLLDFSSSHLIDFRIFNTVVLDEADKMFDMGFYPDISKMFSRMRKKEERQTMLFSATLTTNVRNLAWSYMSDPVEITVQPEEITVKKITQELFHVSSSDKFNLLLSLLKKDNPHSCLIFTNTKDKAVEVSKRLNMNGYNCEYLMGDMSQSKRLETINKMKEGKLSFLVATDVAARGLQIDDLEMVINYDIPEDYENYVHRIGRTARAGKSGKAITLACEEYVYGLEAIENYIQMKIPVMWPEEIGLEKVEDKSHGYTYHRERKTQSKRNGIKNTNKQNLNKKRKVQRKEEVYQNKSELDRLSSLSVDERMAYYKNMYGTKEEKKSVEVKEAPISPKKKSFFKRIISIFQQNKK